jgi:hypothetical protein
MADITATKLGAIEMNPKILTIFSKMAIAILIEFQ